MKKHLLLLLFLTIAHSFDISAQDDGQPIKGTDEFRYRKENEVQSCYIYERYIVKTFSSAGNGVYINIYKKKMPV